MHNNATRWQMTHNFRYHIYFIPLKIVLNDAIAIAYAQSSFHRPALSQEVTAPASVHTSWTSSKNVDPDCDGSDKIDMEIENGGGSGSYSQPGHFGVMDSF